MKKNIPRLISILMNTNYKLSLRSDGTNFNSLNVLNEFLNTNS